MDTVVLCETQTVSGDVYWEAVARMMSEYLTEHQSASPEDVLTDCLIATQCPPSSDDREALMDFHNMWQEILIDSQREIDRVDAAGLGVGPAGRDSRARSRSVCCRPPDVATRVETVNSPRFLTRGDLGHRPGSIPVGEQVCRPLGVSPVME